MARETENFWLKLDRELGIKYGADVHMIEGVEERGGLKFKTRRLNFYGRTFGNAREIYETVKTHNH